MKKIKKLTAITGLIMIVFFGFANEKNLHQELKGKSPVSNMLPDYLPGLKDQRMIFWEQIF